MSKGTLADGLEIISCTHIADITQEDMDILARAFPAYGGGLVYRILHHLEGLRHGRGGFQVDRLEHSLQTATRALRDSRDDEYVVAALLHDIGDELCPHNHPDLAASILKPFVRPEIHWMIQHHDIFQGYYFLHFMGRDRNEREQFRDHPNYELTREFCELYDSPTFDPAYRSELLETFTPILHRVFAAPKGVYVRPPLVPRKSQNQEMS